MFDSPGQQQVLPARKTAPFRVTPEIDKAVLDEQERRKRAGMNRELSRLSMPSLQGWRFVQKPEIRRDKDGRPLFML